MALEIDLASNIDQFDGPRILPWLLADLGSSRWQWYRRHGLSWERANTDFWTFLIPGVGAAPVKSYLVIISLFALTIGPLNYWWLRRQGRLSLLLLTVPAGAAVITVSLLVYALISDGLGTRVRCRSFTKIDSETGLTQSWSRQSYYAGLAPSGGLVFPRSTAILPISARDADEDRLQRTLRWTERQRLEAGYLTARSLSQMLVVHVQPSERQVQVIQTDIDSPPQAINGLDVPLRHLLVIEDPQTMYWATEVAPGGRAALQSISPTEAARRMGEFMAEHRPSIPIGMPPSRMPRGWSSTSSNLPPATTSSSLLEQQLAQLARPGQFGERSYLAISERAPSTVPLGVQRARQQASVHVIQGSWERP